MTVKHKFTSPDHPQSNGSLERTHLTLKDYFKCNVNKDQNNWDKFLNFAIYNYNTSIYKSTQKTRYELVFGQRAKIPNFLNTPQNKPNYSYLANDLATKLQIIRETAKENPIGGKEKSRQYYDKSHNRTFNGNDEAYDAKSKAKMKKLSQNYKGPYKIIQIHNNK